MEPARDAKGEGADSLVRRKLDALTLTAADT